MLISLTWRGVLFSYRLQIKVKDRRIEQNICQSDVGKWENLCILRRSASCSSPSSNKLYWHRMPVEIKKLAFFWTYIDTHRAWFTLVKFEIIRYGILSRLQLQSVFARKVKSKNTRTVGDLTNVYLSMHGKTVYVFSIYTTTEFVLHS